MKYLRSFALVSALLLLLTACSTVSNSPAPSSSTAEFSAENVVAIELSDQQVMVNGVPANTAPEAAVYTANDIIYYASGMDHTYGEGTEADSHSAEEAAAHTVVHITQPGTYSLSGTLSRGQIAVDLGPDSTDNPDAVVTLVLNGAEITCEVAPAIIFYNVYECGSTDTELATKDVTTTAAGANVIITDHTTNTIRGSYVARIYKPGSVVLSEDGTTVEDAKKLHKYDGAFYSKMSMNITSGPQNTGVLNIFAENEGLDSELHLTINGGQINISSGNDGINTNEDGVSVTTVNGGQLTIQVTGQTGEGDGIDSNGWLVINGGTILAQACSNSADAGIDSDMGIHINGGTVIATGHMLDRIESSRQNYAVFQFSQKQEDIQPIRLQNESGQILMEADLQNAYSILICSSPDLIPGPYSLWSGNVQLAGQSGNMFGKPEEMLPPDPEFSEHPDSAEPPRMPPDLAGMEPPTGDFPPAEQKPSLGQKPERAELPGYGMSPQRFEWEQERSPEFMISDGGVMFSGVSPWN